MTSLWDNYMNLMENHEIIISKQVGVDEVAGAVDVLPQGVGQHVAHLQSGASGHSLGLEDKNLGSSPGLLGQ